MKLVYRPSDRLPRLSWCAEIKQGSDEVIVRHGQWVETRPDRFFEGAWSGSFAQGDFDQADTMAGTGGLTRDGRILFSPPSDTSNWLISVRTPARLLVSNSMVFALVCAGDKPAASYPYYFFDVMHRVRWGIRDVRTLMPTHKGNTMDLHAWNIFQVHLDLSIQSMGRVQVDEFQTFDDYRKLLFTKVQEVLENASDQARIKPFRPVAGVSQGYDSPACAVAMAAAGCTEALTFSRPPETEDGWTDNGEEIARHLGMHATVYQRADYDVRTDLIDAEFCANGTSGTGAPLSLAEQQLEGAILSVGRPGSLCWDPDHIFNTPDLLAGVAKTTNSTSVIEFRLRTGYMHFGIPWIGAVHRKKFQEFSDSEEFRAYWIPGGYNKPIARRLVEDTGVPRSAFGQHKMGTNTRPSKSMPKIAAADFQSFYDSLDIPSALRRGRLPLWQYHKAPLDILYALGIHWPDRKKRLYHWTLPLTLLSDRRAGASMPMSDLHLLHWGFDRINNRYHDVVPATGNEPV